MRTLILALSGLGLLAASTPTVAATHCRDSKGKYVKCSASTNVSHCRDSKGHYVKCGTLGSKPA